MTARIYKPAKTAMQSGQANTNEWVIDFEPVETSRSQRRDHGLIDDGTAR